MSNQKTVKRSFSINISLLVIIVVTVLLLAVFTIMFINIRSIYIENFRKRTIDVNSFVASQINGDKIEAYAKDFNKDEYYYELNSMLYRLKDIFQIEYLYIMVDIGDRDTYSVIYDANIDELTQSYDDSRYGATDPKSDFPGSENVLKYGLPFKEALYSETEEYGRVFYAYSPINNSKGYAVAFLGTDISAEEMFSHINNIAIFLTLFGLISFIAIYFIIMLYCKNYVSRPLVKLSSDVTGFSEGELSIEIPDKLLNRTDELGLIYYSFSNVISTISSLMKDLGKTADDVIKGSIGARIDSGDNYRGSYKSIAESIDLLVDNTRKIFNLMPVYFSVYDYDFNILYKNTPAKSFIDAEYDRQLLENEINDHTTKALKENFLEFIQSTEEIRTGSFSIVLSVAAVRHYNYFLIKNNPRVDIKNICCVLTDVTDHVEMSQKALASSMAKGEFLSKMSHEIRTPMNAIIGMTEIAKRQTDIDKIMSNLDNIQSSSSHLLKLINDILDISKIESGKIEISHIIFDLKKMLNDISAIAGKLASDKYINLIIAPENKIDSNMLFFGDEMRIKQVLINLLSNAIKFSPIDAEVRLDVCLDKGAAENKTKIYFAIKDSGIGIAPDKIDKIFEAFEQGGSEITRNFGGTGLGLPISNNLVRLMGGEKINVTSEVNKGSVFSFTLELENADNSQMASEDDIFDISVGKIDFSGKKLLLVDDIDINREIVASFLEGSGIEIECCDDGEVAVKKFAESPEYYFDMIFMDIQMKVMDGYTASKKIRALDRKDASEIIIIGMSANAFQSDIEAGHSAGMNDYIVKPVDYNIMIKKMKKYLHNI